MSAYRSIERYLIVGIAIVIFVTFGIGDPDLPTPRHILDALHEAAEEPVNHRYPESEGLPELRRSISDWYERRFEVKFDPHEEPARQIPDRREGRGRGRGRGRDRGDRGGRDRGDRGGGGDRGGDRDD